MADFSVLISIYNKEKKSFFERAMKSIWEEQTVKPKEIILVQDGILTEELYEAIRMQIDKIGTKLIIVKLMDNVGLGDALNKGLEYCTCELVARMDTDDIAKFNRFEKQIKIFEEKDIDICSSWVSEFDKDENLIIAHRYVPEFDDEIKKYAIRRNPLNHPAVMYKKSIIQKAGGYRKMIWFEDYYLWVRMILIGAKFYNIPEALVSMRAGYGQLQRRSGIQYAKNEYIFQNKIYNLGFLTQTQFLQNIILKLIIRIMPKIIVKRVYRYIRK